jgi:prevent-host-death family protein
MKRTVSAMEARRRLGELLESVYYRGDEVVIERAGKVMGVVIPASRYEAIQENRDWLLRFMHDLHEANKDVPEDEIAADVAAAVREARESRRKRLPDTIGRIQHTNRGAPDDELEASKQTVKEARALRGQRGA